jgi:hypothetical protein
MLYGRGNVTVGGAVTHKDEFSTHKYYCRSRLRRGSITTCSDVCVYLATQPAHAASYDDASVPLQLMARESTYCPDLLYPASDRQRYAGYSTSSSSYSTVRR